MAKDAVSGMFWKPAAGMINKIRILHDPIYKGPEKDPATGKEYRATYQFIVATVENPKTPVVWPASAKGALQQIVGILKANNLQTLVGAVLQVTVTGEGMKTQYVIIPIELPTPANGAQVLLDFPAGSLEKALPKLFQPDIPQAPSKGA